MNLFNKLDGYKRSPPGLEWEIWKKLHIIFATGTFIPFLVSAAVYVIHVISPEMIDLSTALHILYVAIGLVILHWTLVFTLAIGCVIVMVMKGPAYVADAYYLEESDRVNKTEFQRK